MLKNQKAVFIFLCLVMFVINGYLHLGEGPRTIESFIGGAIGGSLLSIPLWSCIGIVLAQIGLFFWKIIKPEEGFSLTLLQKASLGLITGIVLKPIFGILW